MNGLSIEPELGLLSTRQDGRIVMIFASSTVPASKIMEFYGTTWLTLVGTVVTVVGSGDEKLVIGAVKQPWSLVANHATAKLISSEHC